MRDLGVEFGIAFAAQVAEIVANHGSKRNQPIAVEHDARTWLEGKHCFIVLGHDTALVATSTARVACNQLNAVKEFDMRSEDTGGQGRADQMDRHRIAIGGDCYEAFAVDQHAVEQTVVLSCSGQQTKSGVFFKEQASR